MTHPILLSTLGTHGDLFPVLALAEALEAAGQPVKLLLTEDDAALSVARGLRTVRIGPSQDSILAPLGLSRDDLVAQVFKDPTPLLRDIILPNLSALTRECLPHMAGARAVCGTMFAFGAPDLAELHRLPYIPILLQPMACFSALAPPRARRLSPPMLPAPRSALARGWNRTWLGLAKRRLRAQHLGALNRVRAELGLPPSRAVPMMEQSGAIPLRLGLWDAAFSPAPPDAPAHLALTGFPTRPAAAALPPALEQFLRAGPPPLCVSLGSMAQNLGGADFYPRAIALARSLGLRVVALSGAAQVPTGADVCAAARADHASLFPRCAAVLHHGGIGTTAAALFAGTPQLIYPLGADQFDTAAHVVRHGLGRRLPRRLDAGAARDVLSCAPACAAFAARLDQDGSARAARVLIDTLGAGAARQS